MDVVLYVALAAFAVGAIRAWRDLSNGTGLFGKMSESTLQKINGNIFLKILMVAGTAYVLFALWLIKALLIVMSIIFRR